MHCLAPCIARQCVLCVQPQAIMLVRGICFVSRRTHATYSPCSFNLGLKARMFEKYRLHLVMLFEAKKRETEGGNP